MRPRPCDVGFTHVAYDVDEVVAAVDAASRHGFLPLGPPTEVDQGPNRGPGSSISATPTGSPWS